MRFKVLAEWVVNGSLIKLSGGIQGSLDALYRNPGKVGTQKNIQGWQRGNGLGVGCGGQTDGGAWAVVLKEGRGCCGLMGWAQWQ
eukprot:scaffold3984_cov155-Amphora_coffeaeformis.AAC.2